MPLTFPADVTGALWCRERRGVFDGSDGCELLDKDRVRREGESKEAAEGYCILLDAELGRRAGMMDKPRSRDGY